MTEVLRYAAFAETPLGGNPAGVVLDATGLDEHTMQTIAKEVGYSETAFLTPAAGGAFNVRYFAPSIEVPFCGHATIATGVALGERRGTGPFVLHTQVGEVPVDVTDAAGRFRATLTSVEPDLADLDRPDLEALLTALRWSAADLDDQLPPKVAYAGAWHPVIAAKTRQRLADLSYDFEALRRLMTEKGWTTVQLVWREAPTIFHVRNPFPVGGIVEDPATGAAAAALGHYLRELGAATPPTRLTIHQGVDMGRPSVLTVDLDTDDRRVMVSGTAAAIATP
jgi:PhzF family phenazine biosynthesis protein